MNWIDDEYLFASTALLFFSLCRCGAVVIMLVELLLLVSVSFSWRWIKHIFATKKKWLLTAVPNCENIVKLLVCFCVRHRRRSFLVCVLHVVENITKKKSLRQSSAQRFVKVRCCCCCCYLVAECVCVWLTCVVRQLSYNHQIIKNFTSGCLGGGWSPKLKQQNEFFLVS